MSIEPIGSTSRCGNNDSRPSPSSAVPRWLIPITLGFCLIVLVISVAIGYCYLEPVKSKRLLRQVRDDAATIIFAKRGQRSGRIADYESTVLQGAAKSVSQSPSSSEDICIRLMDREFEADSPSSLRKVSVRLDGQNRNAVMGVVPFSFAYKLRIPEDSHVWFGLNQEGMTSPSTGLQITVEVVDGLKKHLLFEDTLPMGHAKWKDHVLDLSSFANSVVKIQFNVSASNSNVIRDALQAPIKAYFSDLFLGIRSSRRPNIFLILIDTLRADHLSSYGYNRPTSPNIDKIASKGVLFEKAFSACPWTDPSILALFSGLYPSDVWVPKPHKEAIWEVVPKGVDTIAEILSVNGYFTLAASDHPGINARRFGQGFDIYLDLWYMEKPYYKHWRDTAPKNVLEQLHQLLEAKSSGGFFAYVHLIYPHLPYLPPSPYDNLFGRGTFREIAKNKKALINMYDGEIKLADDLIGNFLVDIHNLKLDDNSIIIITSDHGEGFWEHGLFEHGNSLYNELLHVPLIFYAPGRLAQGKIVSELVRTVDILPTIMELVNINQGGYLRGRSLLPLIKYNGNPKRLAFAEFPHSRIVQGRAIQSSTEKLIDPRRKGYLPEYYDISSDPKELNNLSTVKLTRTSELIANMRTIDQSAKAGRVAYEPEQHEPSQDLLRKLKALGYIK